MLGKRVKELEKQLAQVHFALIKLEAHVETLRVIAKSNDLNALRDRVLARTVLQIEEER